MAKHTWYSRMLRRSRWWKLALAVLAIAFLVFVSLVISDVDPVLTRRRSTLSLNGKVKREDQWMETLSWEPRVFVYHNFLSKEECDFLIELAKPHMKKSLVIDPKTGQGKKSSVRTSTGTFLLRGQDVVIQNIEKRIADFTFIPVENGEGIQILHYEVGQTYRPHNDYFVDSIRAKAGNQRIATVLMYLSDVEEGGETVFPSAKVNVTYLSKCGKKGLFVKPKIGDAVLFWNLKPDGTLDPLSIHGGCPVIKGSKWVATKWIHVKEY